MINYVRGFLVTLLRYFAPILVTFIFLSFYLYFASILKSKVSGIEWKIN